MSKWLDALKAKSRISASRDKADSIDTIQVPRTEQEIVSVVSALSPASEKSIGVDQIDNHAASTGHMRISESADTADSVDTIPDPGLDAQNCVSKVRCVRDLKNAETSPVQPGHIKAPPPRDMLRETLGDENFTPPLKVPRDSGLTEIPPEGMMCATCGGCAWRRGPGGVFHCDEPTCSDHTPFPAVRRPVQTRFLWPPDIVPDPCGVCVMCGGARWGHSPTMLEATGFDGWKRWACMSCHRQEMQRPDVQVFTGEAAGDRR